MIKLIDYMKKSKSERQSHLDLNEDCIVRGTTSTHCRGILAHYLDTDMNTMKVDCCHACNNDACSNPKHIYWGTRSENVFDLLENNPEIRKKYGANGKRNVNFGVMPWRNIAVNVHPKIRGAWFLSEYIFTTYFQNNWDFSKYGKGPTYFENKYRCPRSTISNMWKMFNSGWNPSNDEDFISWKNSLK